MLLQENPINLCLLSLYLNFLLKHTIDYYAYPFISSFYKSFNDQVYKYLTFYYEKQILQNLIISYLRIINSIKKLSYLKGSSYGMEANHSNKQETLQYISHILDLMLSQICQSRTKYPDKSLSQIIPHTFNKNYNIHLGKCYQQHTSNLCGYHATFNSYCFMKIFANSWSEYDIQTCGSFWKFKTRIQKFLINFADQMGYEQWPWTKNDIKNGDFQRVYNRVCREKFQDFYIFRSQQKFTYLSHTWSFQYNNLLLQQQDLEQLQASFRKFAKYCSQDKPIVFQLMLGITTHWLTFFGVKTGNKTEYWLFDSQNENYLDYNQEQIQQYIERQSKQAVKYGRKQSTEFEKKADCQCIRDIQKSLKIIVGCLQGTYSLQQFCYNRKFEVFADRLCGAFDDIQLASKLVRQYQMNITQFLLLKVQWSYFTEQNSVKMKRLGDLAQKLKDFSEEGMYFYSLVAMQNQFI